MKIVNINSMLIFHHSVWNSFIRWYSNS